MRRRAALQERDGAAHADSPSLPIQGNISPQQTESAGDGSVKNAKTRDGRTLNTSSEEWRMYCEAEFVLSLPDKSDKRLTGWKAVSKREYLSKIREKRGQAAHDALRVEMLRLWKSRSQIDQK